MAKVLICMLMVTNIGMYRNGKRNGFGKAYYLSDGKIKDYFHSGSVFGRSKTWIWSF